MGFSTTADGRLCCDVCDNVRTDGKPAKRQRCPHGYCSPTAVCDRPECIAQVAKYRAERCGTTCKTASAEFKARNEEFARRLADGEMLRTAAVLDDGLVKVWFKCIHGDRVGWMSRESYNAIPLLTVASLKDYEAHGWVWLDSRPVDSPVA